jgi:hypothetical protein
VAVADGVVAALADGACDVLDGPCAFVVVVFGPLLPALPFCPANAGVKPRLRMSTVRVEIETKRMCTSDNPTSNAGAAHNSVSAPA